MTDRCFHPSDRCRDTSNPRCGPVSGRPDGQGNCVDRFHAPASARFGNGHQHNGGNSSAPHNSGTTTLASVPRLTPWQEYAKAIVEIAQGSHVQSSHTRSCVADSKALGIGIGAVQTHALNRLKRNDATASTRFYTPLINNAVCRVFQQFPQYVPLYYQAMNPMYDQHPAALALIANLEVEPSSLGYDGMMVYLYNGGKPSGTDQRVEVSTTRQNPPGYARKDVAVWFVPDILTLRQVQLEHINVLATRFLRDLPEAPLF